ncbi:MAG: hypothetical protein ACKVOR_11190 [Flavobacteriales bacterium]
MEKIIYIFASHTASDSEFDYVLRDDRSIPASQLERIRILDSMDVRTMAARILSALGTGNTIKKLVVLCHGNAGAALIGTQINASSVGSLSPLRGRFSPVNDGVLLAGCNIASGTSVAMSPMMFLSPASCADDEGGREFTEAMLGTWRSPSERRSGMSPGFIGLNFLRLFASTVGVPVVASIDTQLGGVSMSAGRRVDTTGFEGRRVTVFPDGTVSEVEHGMSYTESRYEYCHPDS